MLDYEQSVLCFPRKHIEDCDRFTPWDSATGVIRSVESDMTWLPRREVEESEDLIQPIPCALVLGDRWGYRIFPRITEGRQDLRRKISLVVGGHIDRITERTDFASLVLMTLERELIEELGTAPSAEATPIGLVIDNSSPEASRHVGIVHEVIISGQVKPIAFEEFSIGSKNAGRLCTKKELSDLHSKLDPWSTIIFADYINPSYCFDVGKQLTLLPLANPTPQ